MEFEIFILEAEKVKRLKYYKKSTKMNKSSIKTKKNH